MAPPDGIRIGSLLAPVAVAGVVLTLLAPLVFSAGRSTLGVALGAVLAVANLWAVALVIRGLSRGAGLPWGIVAAVKFGALLFIVAIVLKNHWAEALPLSLGYASLPIGVVLGQLFRAPVGGRG
jgi:hypothetical protein